MFNKSYCAMKKSFLFRIIFLKLDIYHWIHVNFSGNIFYIFKRNSANIPFGSKCLESYIVRSSLYQFLWILSINSHGSVSSGYILLQIFLDVRPKCMSQGLRLIGICRCKIFGFLASRCKSGLFCNSISLIWSTMAFKNWVQFGLRWENCRSSLRCMGLKI